MSDAQSFEVNFGQPLGLFPLSSVVLMPHSPSLLQVFEPRYLQLVRDALADANQFAMATFDGDAWRDDYLGEPPIRPIVCIGQMIRCQPIDGDRLVVLLQGLCRARIIRELPPDPNRLYRRALLEPIGLEFGDESRLNPFRRRLSDGLEHRRLSDLKDAQELVRLLKDDQIPTDVLMGIVGHRFIMDQERRYQLLASDDPIERAAMVSQEMLDLQRLLDRAAPQRTVDAPKGVSWN